MQTHADIGPLESVLGRKIAPLTQSWLAANSTLPAEDWNQALEKEEEIYHLQTPERPEKIFILTRDAHGFFIGRWVDPNDPYDLALLNEDYGAALEIAETRLEAEPEDPDALFDKAYALSADGQKEDAIACYKELLLIEPDNAAAHNNIGAALEALGRHEEAFYYYKKGVELDPDCLLHKSNLAAACVHRGDYEESCHLLEEIMKAEPEDVENRLFLHNFKIRKGWRTMADFQQDKPFLMAGPPAPLH